ncbi:MAG: hypothetical protein FGM14_12525 [Flavobacteriales bacterium]|nr:hypothetical protein [Flavobacteriales bacterium]
MDNKQIRVVSKIDNYQIVINRGAQDKVNSFMRFLVYKEGNEIFDPLTKQSLGFLEIPKGIFKVFHIQDKMTVLVSTLKKDNKLMAFQAFSNGIDIEKDLLFSIQIGDKVKIINEN